MGGILKIYAEENFEGNACGIQVSILTGQRSECTWK
jgi:hypothetical protein